MEALNELLQRFKSLPQWQRITIVLVLGVLSFWLLYNFNIKPLREELNQKEAEAEQLALTVSRLKVIEKRKQALEKEIEKLKKKIALLEEELPTGKEDVAQILKSIATQNKAIDIEFLRREKEEKHKYYEAYPYTIIVKTTYPDFLWWCEKISKADRIINFANIEVVSVDDKKHSIRAKMRIKAFTLKK
jgi:type IV pilus assembly protein PilO